MASASPLTTGTSADVPACNSVEPPVEPVSQQELNAWRRGFTPQAEIWNGRLAMLGLSVGLTILLISRLASHSS
ncbi:MAG: high light inducible protein [Synechococcaceae cyanobacterium]|nr:high light inducible protein [Synechococcaceae cyanobacterium]